MIRTPEQKYALLFEALKRSLLVIHRLRRRLSTSLGEVEALLRKRTTFEEQAADALVDAISLIDFLHRYGALADALPLVPKRAKPLAKLRTTLVDVEVARNYLQHIRGDLSTNAGISYPVLGAVMWSTGPDAYNLQFSQAIEANLQAVFEVAPCANMTCYTYPREFSEQRGRYDDQSASRGSDARSEEFSRAGRIARSPWGD